MESNFLKINNQTKTTLFINYQPFNNLGSVLN